MGDQHSLTNSEDGAQVSDDFQKEVCATDRNASAPDSGPAAIAGSEDCGVSDAFRKEDKTDVHDPVSEVGFSHPAGGGGPQVQSPAVFEAMRFKDGLAPAAENDDTNESMSDAASLNSNAASLSTPAQKTV